MFNDILVFLREGVREIGSTGALFPTSRWAVRALVQPLAQRNTLSPMRILEVGPGTGAATVQILQHLQPGDELVLCEMNPRLMEALKQLVANNPFYQAHKERISFHTCPVQELPDTGGKFDVIICAIPFMNLPVTVAESIFQKFSKLSHERTHMTYYEYMWLRAIGRSFNHSPVGERLKALSGFFKDLHAGHLKRRFKEYRNLPPVYVYHVNDLHRFSPVATSVEESLPDQEAVACPQ